MESFYKKIGFIKGNWFGPNWCGGLYNVDTTDAYIIEPSHASTEVYTLDVISKYHDMALALFSCKDLPLDYRIKEHRKADYLTGYLLLHHGYFFPGVIVLISHYTGLSVLRSKLHRDYTPAECVIVKAEFEKSLALVNLVFPGLMT